MYIHENNSERGRWFALLLLFCLCWCKIRWYIFYDQIQKLSETQRETHYTTFSFSLLLSLRKINKKCGYLSTKDGTGICIHLFVFCPRYKSRWRTAPFHKASAFARIEDRQILEDTSTNIRRMWGYITRHSDKGVSHKMFANSNDLHKEQILFRNSYYTIIENFTYEMSSTTTFER